VLDRNQLHQYPWTAGFAAVLLHSLARFLSLEGELGISASHAEAIQIVDHYLNRLDRTVSPLEQRCKALEAENERLRGQLEHLQRSMDQDRKER
jgi:hypothetical protein